MVRGPLTAWQKDRVFYVAVLFAGGLFSARGVRLKEAHFCVLPWGPRLAPSRSSLVLFIPLALSCARYLFLYLSIALSLALSLSLSLSLTHTHAHTRTRG